MFYERLTALDASFLAIEDANTHMHVAATLIFDAGPLRTPEGGLDMERIRTYIGSRLHLIPRYRQRLVHTPLERHPVWVDDHRFNLFYHVRHTSLPQPGSERQLKRLCGRILSQKLDLTKPLWEIWVVEGLHDGSFALIAKAHHCMVDGVSGMDLLTLLLSPDESTIGDTPRWAPRRAPNAIELLAGEVRRRAEMPFTVLRAMRESVSDPWATWETVRDKLDAVTELLSQATVRAPAMPINPEHIGPHRRFDWVRLDLGRVKEVKNQLGGTVNDVVLTSIVGAVRRYLAGRGPTGRSPLDLRVMIPVNIRSREQQGALGNRVAQMVASLPLGEDHPRRIHQRVVAATESVKNSHQAEATELIEEFSDWTATAVLTQLVRFAAKRRPYNLVVTNVPGPPIPLYLLGARLLHSYPMVPLFSNQALGIALFSYIDGIYFGVNADWDALPDVHDFVEAIDRSFEDLYASAAAVQASQRRATATRSAAGARRVVPVRHGVGSGSQSS
jgi:diacylglycerol O-acyltransferase